MYTIKEASARSGVGIPLLRAWERRYGVVRPMRTASGYRLYDDDAIARLRAMRQLIAGGWSAQQAAGRVLELGRAALAELAGSGERAESGPIDVGTGASTIEADLVARLVSAAIELDARAVERALDESFAAGRFEMVADRIIMPALRAIGEAWAREELSVAGEHAASHAILRRLAMAYEAAGDPVAERPILVGLGPGGRHELGALAFATAARRAGMSVLYLGPDLPPESWISAAITRRARAAVIGVPTRADVPRARAVIEALRQVPGDILLAAGGDAAAKLDGGGDVLRLSGAIGESIATLGAALADRGEPAG